MVPELLPACEHVPGLGVMTWPAHGSGCLVLHYTPELRVSSYHGVMTGVSVQWAVGAALEFTLIEGPSFFISSRTFDLLLNDFGPVAPAG